MVLCSIQLSANEGVYVKAISGINWLDSCDDFCSPGYIVGGSLGYKFCNGFGLEGEIAYRHNRIKSHVVIVKTAILKCIWCMCYMTFHIVSEA